MNGKSLDAAENTEAGSSESKGLLGKVLIGTAFITCPCHLPIYLLLLGGTALGGYLAENKILAAVALTLVFGASLVSGMRMVKTK